MFVTYSTIRYDSTGKRHERLISSEASARKRTEPYVAAGDTVIITKSLDSNGGYEVIEVIGNKDFLAQEEAHRNKIIGYKVDTYSYGGGRGYSELMTLPAATSHAKWWERRGSATQIFAVYAGGRRERVLDPSPAEAA